jgi:hypothetical protein
MRAIRQSVRMLLCQPGFCAAIVLTCALVIALRAE